ncbi:MAG: hypothetical protein V4501_08275 [Pseudomonadota bacterium]
MPEQFYAKIKEFDQIKRLKVLNLKSGFEFKFDLFFESKPEKLKYLLSSQRCIIWCRDGFIDSGNLDNVGVKWEEKSLDDFIKAIAVYDSMGIPTSCGKPLCNAIDHHPLCKLHVSSLGVGQ